MKKKMGSSFPKPHKNPQIFGTLDQNIHFSTSLAKIEKKFGAKKKFLIFFC